MKFTCISSIVFVLACGALVSSACAKDKMERIYFGTYTSGRNQGIFVAELDLATGVVSNLRPAGEAVNPSFLAIPPSHKFLYAVTEVDSVDGRKTGGVVAFAVDPATGKLERLNAESSGGSGPCHLSVDKAGKNVLVANYSDGKVAALPIDETGRLKPPSSVIQHRGKGANPARQEGPHAHSINFDPANRFAFAADLGLDKVLIYRFDAASGTLSPNEPPAARLAPGAGPRHFAFHPSGQFAYLISEMGNTITVFRYDADSGTLHEIQTLSTLPADFKGESYTAEVVVHPSGRFVYGSNRGHDSLAIFSVDAATGKLTPVGYEPTQGHHPRNFAIDPTGKFLLAANMNSDTVVVFRVDPATGRLEPTGQTLKLSRPSCVRFIPLGSS